MKLVRRVPKNAQTIKFDDFMKGNYDIDTELAQDELFALGFAILLPFLIKIGTML